MQGKAKRKLTKCNKIWELNTRSLAPKSQCQGEGSSRSWIAVENGGDRTGDFGHRHSGGLSMEITHLYPNLLFDAGKSINSVSAFVGTAWQNGREEG